MHACCTYNQARVLEGIFDQGVCVLVAARSSTAKLVQAHAAVWMLMMATTAEAMTVGVMPTKEMPVEGMAGSNQGV